MTPEPTTIEVQHYSPEEVEKIKDWLKREIDRAYRDRHELEGKWATWVKQFDGRMERNDSPAAWQSRVDFATTRKHLQHVGARLVNPFFNQEQVVVAKPRTPDWDDFATKTTLLLDYLFDSFDAQQLMTDVTQDHMVYGFGVVKVPFTNRRERGMDWVQQPTGEIDPMTGEQVMTTVEAEVEIPVEVGAIPQYICPSDLLWPSYAKKQEVTPWIADRFYLTMDDIQARQQDPDYGWYPGIEGKLACVEELDPVTKIREELTGIAPSEKRYEFLEIYVNRFPLSLGVQGKAVVTINRQSGEVVRAIRNYYHRYQDPYVILYWQKHPNSMESTSLCYHLEPYHRVVSATVCMELDAASLAVKGRFPYTNDQQIAEQLKSSTRAMGDLVQGTTPPNEALQMIELYRESPTSLPSLRQETKLEAEQIANLNPYNRGEEQAQRPTASGQAMLVEQGLEPIKERLEKVRSWTVRLALVMLARVKQFHQNYIEFTTFIDQDIIPVQLSMPPGAIEGKLLVETMASGSTMNESVRQQQIIGIIDRMTQSYQTMTQMAEAGANQAMQGSPLWMLYAAYLQGYQHLVDRLLKEFKVPDRELINPQIDPMEILGQIAEMAMMMPPPPGGPDGSDQPPAD